MVRRGRRRRGFNNGKGIMATITIHVDTEEALIKAGIPRPKWAEYVNKAAMEKLRSKE